MNERIQPLVIQEYIARARNCKGMISFAAGLPDLSVLPIDTLKVAYEEIKAEMTSAFQYQPPPDSLKEKIQYFMQNQSVTCNLEEILITNGAQQAIYLTALLFFREAASLVTEEFVYPGFFQISNTYNLRYLSVPCHHKKGLDLEYLEAIVKQGDVLPYFYTVCNGHNPQGTTLDVAKRQHLAYLAEKYDFIIVEDDPYCHFNFSDKKFLPLRAYTKNAIYVGSFSKIIAPSVRVGWVVADKPIIEKLHQLKDMTDLYLSNPNHLAVNYLLERKTLEGIALPQRIHYQKKRDHFVKTLQAHLKVPCNYSIPVHGMFLWLEFPTFDIENLYDDIVKQSKVLFIPASAFSMTGKTSKQAIRLSFTYPSFDEIRKGVKQLSETLNEFQMS
jgi:2-aminoadipate transaminase